jgi:putative heme-binding domain-containing protein
LQDLHDAEVDTWLAKNWGAVRTSPADKQAQIARIKAFLSTDSILKADASRGRALFTQTCAICHTLYGYGAKIGPELPGSFEDVDYLLLNIVDPDAIIGKDYQQVLVHTKDGQTLSGIIASDDNNAVSLKSLAGVVTVQRADITSMEVSPHSLMPEGLITALDEQSVRDLFFYLRQRAQVPILATPLNTADFFNGNDLSRWRASSDDAWKVENGEIAGRGRAKQANWLKSEMIAGEFKFSAMVKLTGKAPVAEIAYYGRPDQTPFVGQSLSFGGNTGVNSWFYTPGEKPRTAGPTASVVPNGKWTKLEIVSAGDEFRLSVDGQLTSFGGTKTRPPRNGVAFYVLGDDTELRVKDLKLEIPQK